MSQITSQAELKTYLEREVSHNDEIDHIISFATLSTNERDNVGIEALVRRRKRDGTSEIHNITLRNWVVNWRELQHSLIPIATAADNGAGHAVRILSVLAALAVLAGAATTKLTNSHAEMVEMIYRSEDDFIIKKSLKENSRISDSEFEKIIQNLLDIGVILLVEDVRIYKTTFILYV